MFDAKILIDPLREQFKLPATLVKCTHGENRELKMIAHEHRGLPDSESFNRM